MARDYRWCIRFTTVVYLSNKFSPPLQGSSSFMKYRRRWMVFTVTWRQCNLLENLKAVAGIILDIKHTSNRVCSRALLHRKETTNLPQLAPTEYIDRRYEPWLYTRSASRYQGIIRRIKVDYVNVQCSQKYIWLQFISHLNILI